MLVYNKEPQSKRVWTKGCRLMLVRQPVIISQRVGDRRKSACEQMGARFEKIQHYFPCHPCLCSSCTFSILTPILARSSSIGTLTYTTQVRSGGSQVFVGYRNHRAEPVAVLRRAPTLTDEQRQQRVGSRALSPSKHLAKCAKERPRES